MRAIRLVPIVLVLALAWAPRASAAAPPVDELLTMVNVERAAAGVPPLALRDDLTDIAGGWSASMADAGVLAHNDAYFSAEVRQRIGPGARAENVAYAGDVASVHRVLMTSPPHRANLLDPRMTVVGIGAVFDGRLWWVTQALLAAPASPVPAPPAAPVVDTPTPAEVPALPDAEARPLSVSLAPATPAPVVVDVAPAAQAPPMLTIELEVAPDTVPPAAAPPTSTVGASAEPVAPRGSGAGIPGLAWVALVALGVAAAATTRASRAARA
jgi:hypothetical protein